MMIRGIVSAVTDGIVRLIAASGLAGQTFDKREFIQQYGLASHPKAGAEVIFLVQGNVITAIASDDRRYRLALEDGEAALYDDLGQKVHLTRSGIQVTSPLKITATAPEVDIVATSKVVMTTPLLDVSGSIKSGGSISAVGNIADANGTKTMSAMRNTYNVHTHQEHGTGGGITSITTQGM